MIWARAPVGQLATPPLASWLTSVIGLAEENSPVGHIMSAYVSVGRSFSASRASGEREAELLPSINAALPINRADIADTLKATKTTSSLDRRAYARRQPRPGLLPLQCRQGLSIAGPMAYAPCHELVTLAPIMWRRSLSVAQRVNGRWDAAVARPPLPFGCTPGLALVSRAGMSLGLGLRGGKRRGTWL
jgi:hypothetical protein